MHFLSVFRLVGAEDREGGGFRREAEEDQGESVAGEIILGRSNFSILHFRTSHGEFRIFIDSIVLNHINE